MTETAVRNEEEIQFAGRIGIWTVGALAVLLAVHPLGTSDLYSDGGAFLEHVGIFWVAIHVVAALLLLLWPALIAVWARNLASARAQFVGQAAAFAAAMGMAVGAVHLIATDTMTFIAFGDTFASGNGNEAVTVGADLLLRIHASTLTAWAVSFWLLTPALVAWACHLDRRIPWWMSTLGLVAAACQVAAVAVTVSERQWTTVSETGLLRTGITLFIGLMLVMTWSMRQAKVAPGRPAA